MIQSDFPNFDYLITLIFTNCLTEYLDNFKVKPPIDQPNRWDKVVVLQSDKVDYIADIAEYRSYMKRQRYVQKNFISEKENYEKTFNQIRFKITLLIQVVTNWLTPQTQTTANVFPELVYWIK